MKFHWEILKSLRFCGKKKFCYEFCITHLKNCIDLMNNEEKCDGNWIRQENNSPRASKIFHNYQFDNLTLILARPVLTREGGGSIPR